MPKKSRVKIIGICGKGGAGKDTLYENVLKPRGFIRWQMTLHYKTWLVATRRATFDEVFITKPPHVRKILQNEITDLRKDWSENIWLDVFKSWMVSLREIVGINTEYVAVTDLRFVIEMEGIKEMGGKIIHMESVDQQSRIAPELRGHRSEAEMDSPKVLMIRDAYIFNEKNGIDQLKHQGNLVMRDWGWK